MDKWDKEESKNSLSVLGSKKALVLLIGVMIAMWIIIFGLSYYALPINNCDDINEFVDSDAFYSLPESETRQNYIDAQYECNRDSIIVR